MSLITRTDITAVKLFKNLIIGGIGSSVNMFEKDHFQLIQKIQIFKGQKIYGIVSSKCDQKVLLFGGKQFSVLLRSDMGIKFDQLFESVVCDDWLHSGIWLNGTNVGLLTAHNVVQIWDTTKQVLLSKYYSKDNSILYSGLLLPLDNDVLVLAGTVFSEVIIHIAGEKESLHHLKGHRGVIFSISCYPEKGILVTTSDDRSVRIWSLDKQNTYSCFTKSYWKNLTINCRYEVYGHTARVMRSCITSKFIISVGEDSAICFWDYKGKLIRKSISHQNSGIWSLDVDDCSLVTGGGDAGIVLHPLTIASDYDKNETITLATGVPKKVVFTTRNNIIILNDRDELIYYDILSKIHSIVCKLNHESTYKLLSLSSCKQIIAIVDMEGNLDIYIENCKYEANVQNIISTKLKIGKILSMQWAGNRHLVLCCKSGGITVLASKENSVEIFENFILPQCKEKWLTAADIDLTSNILVVGDRCGNIHIFRRKTKEPIKTFNKVHGRFGPTSITIKNDEIVTTGRDGTIKHFSHTCIGNFQYIRSNDLEFQWVEKFLDKNETIVCGFHERVFVVHDVKNNLRLVEVLCGGGHRSWDAIRYFKKINNSYEELISLVYLKNSDMHLVTFDLKKIVPRYVINGSHSKEINVLKTINAEITYFISGGEDTTLRISSLSKELSFQDEFVFKNLSNVKALKICSLESNKYLLISAGGRAQISIKMVELKTINDKIRLVVQELIDYLIKGTDKQRKVNQNWRNCSVDFNPETRIMDLDALRVKEDSFVIFGGCSDACLRVFTFNLKNNTIKLLKESKYHKTCILKTECILFNEKNILVTCTTRGEVTFWDISDVGKSDSLLPFFSTKTNKSGINSFSFTKISNKMFLIATGGDDNSIHLNVLKINQNDLSSMIVSDTWTTDKHHSSEVTGLHLVDNVLISSSIDQRVTQFKWSVHEGSITCTFVSQTFCDVADVQGMAILNNLEDTLTVCVYGKGMEVIKIEKPVTDVSPYDSMGQRSSMVK